MSAPWRFFLVIVLTALATGPALAAAPLSCEALQTRLQGLNTAISKKATDKKAVARMQAQLEGLSREYTARCAQAGEGQSARQAQPGLKTLPATSPQAATPEEEIRRRREAINHKGRPFDGKLGSPPAKPAGRDTPVQRAIPVEGTIVIESGASSTFYGKVKQEILYTIRETFVGNLIVTRQYDRAAGRYSEREEYALQTLSAEIDVDHFSGRGCAKYTGSPPTCVQWHKLDLWQIAEGEEYPGRADGVVSAGSAGRGVTVTVDGPDIEFFSSQGSVSVRSGCGDQLRETVSFEEFRQWLRRGQVRIKREMGGARPTMPGCRPGSTLTLEMLIGPES